MGSSWKLVRNTLREYKHSLTLTDRQRSLIIGSILGDGNLRILKRHAFLTVSHSEKQKEYVWWKYKILQNWILTKPREEERRYNKDHTRSLISWRWSTMSHPILTQLYTLFYAEGKKVIPDSIDSVLVSPFAVAIWYMDDGSRKPYGKGAFLHTESFSLDDQHKLIRCLQKNFSITARLSSAGLWRNKRLHRLYITADSYVRFRTLLSPYIIPSLQYKISM